MIFNIVMVQGLSVVLYGTQYSIDELKGVSYKFDDGDFIIARLGIMPIDAHRGKLRPKLPDISIRMLRLQYSGADDKVEPMIVNYRAVKVIDLFRNNDFTKWDYIRYMCFSKLSKGQNIVITV